MVISIYTLLEDQFVLSTVMSSSFRCGNDLINPLKKAQTEERRTVSQLLQGLDAMKCEQNCRSTVFAELN